MKCSVIMIPFRNPPEAIHRQSSGRAHLRPARPLHLCGGAWRPHTLPLTRPPASGLLIHWLCNKIPLKYVFDREAGGRLQGGVWGGGASPRKWGVCGGAGAPSRTLFVYSFWPHIIGAIPKAYKLFFGVPSGAWAGNRYVEGNSLT